MKKTLTEQISSANVSNILKKLKAGKVLTEREQKIVADYEAEQAAPTVKPNSDLIVSVDVVARFLEVTPMTLTNWGRMGMPKQARGLYNLQAVFKWWLENIHKAKAETDEETDARERYWEAKADNEELRRDRTKGKLVLKDGVVGEFAARAAELKTTLRAFRFRVAPLLEGLKHEDISQVIGKEIDTLLNAFCRNGRYVEVLKPVKAPAKKKVTKRKV